LKDSRLPLFKIAEESGFSSVNYYIRCFKKLKNCTPAVFRKNLLRQDFTNFSC
jgi:AraC-like DNA-binding protein